jgi:hypothetical protein
MTQVTFNGHVYSDDGSAARDMQGGGVRNWLLPMLSDAAVEINIAKAAQTYASQASTSASEASNYANQANAYAAAINATSTSSVTVGVGSRSFTVQTFKQFSVGQYVVVARTSAPSTRMYGQVTSYNTLTGALIVDVQLVYGAGTFTDWTISVAGDRGVEGPIARMSYSTKTVPFTAGAGDMGKLFDCTGSFYVSLAPSATLSDGWYFYLINSGTELIIIDPFGSETIDGATTSRLPPGYSCMIECNGTSLRTVWQLPQMDSSPTETSADYNIDYTDTTIVCIPSGASQVITLPSALPMGVGNKFKIINRSTTNTLTVVDNTGYPVYRLAALKSIDAVLKNNASHAGSWLAVEADVPTTGGIVRSGNVTTLLSGKSCHAQQPLGAGKFLHVAAATGASSLQFVVSTVSGLAITVGAATTVSGASGAFVQLLPVTGGFVAIYANGIWSTLYAVAVTVSGDVVTAGTPVGLEASAVYADTAVTPNIDCSTSGTTGVVVYARSTTTVNAVAFTVSGTTITAGTPVTLHTAPASRYVIWSGYGGSHSVQMLSSTSALYTGYLSDGGAPEAATHRAVAFTLSGTTITAGTPLDFATYRSRACGLTKVTATQALWVSFSNGDFNTYAIQLTVSGTSVTAGTLGTIGTATGSSVLGRRVRIEQVAGGYYLFAPGNGLTNPATSKVISNANPPTHFASNNTARGLVTVLTSTDILSCRGQASEDDFFISNMSFTKTAASDVAAGVPTEMNSCSPQAVLTGTREAVVFNGDSCSAYVVRWSL